MIEIRRREKENKEGDITERVKSFLIYKTKVFFKLYPPMDRDLIFYSQSKSFKINYPLSN